MTSSLGQASAVTPLLQAQNLSKRFGGLVAVNDVSLSLFKVAFSLNHARYLPSRLPILVTFVV
jgi:hypothetical protein